MGQRLRHAFADLFDGDGAVVPTRIESAGFLSAVHPLSPLAANRDHRLVVREGDGTLAELTFKTGDFDAAPAPSEAPIVEVRGYEWVPSSSDVARFTVVARQPNGDRFGALSIAYDDGGTDARLPGGDGDVTFVRGLRAQEDVEKCFTVSYADAAGNVSRAPVERASRRRAARRTADARSEHRARPVARLESRLSP